MSKVTQAQLIAELRPRFKADKLLTMEGGKKTNGHQQPKPAQLPLPYQYSLNDDDTWRELLDEYYRSCYSVDYLESLLIK